MPPTARVAVAALSVSVAAWPDAALAQVDLLSRDTVHGVVDLRAAGANGEPSFTDEGFGKSRYGGTKDHGWKGKVEVAEAALEWTPRLAWDWSAVVDVGYQPGQEKRLDVLQAYIVFKPVPRSQTRFKARFGYFYPPVSLEHDARVWGLTNTITPSAINSWAGEEVKVVGAEAEVSHDFGAQQLAATAGLFGYDDTAGTLIAFRGWALHDLKSQAQGRFELPPLSPIARLFQDTETYSTLEIDHRLGWYAKLEWRPDAPVTVEALYFDNRGDRTRVTSDLQWAWATHFVDLGATARLGPHTRVLGQALSGRTIIGKRTFVLTDVAFQAAYAELAQDVGKATLSGRLDAFATQDRAPLPPVGPGEHGWALTGAVRYPLNDYLDLRLEALRIESTRPSRALVGEPPRQGQTVLQSSLRLTF